ncbi:OstA-like protein [Pedobacter gandavensis]|uniref:OstA-like protein n=1 Tax=Pedobacter gandavensis TaxID=2679963 RepID=UPI00247886F4|nr:OstA-like protein [Pedobacter gandavensis]WGQ08259.1 OstA-like protein [Pedobacter gandavensis]
MQKLYIFFILFLLSFSLLAQQKTKIILKSSQRARVEKNSNTTYLRNPVFQQDNATLACDSAIFYEAKNMFDAFGNVHINQADTINIYSDRLTYDGNTKNAHLTSNVKMIDKESILTTNILDYNLGSKVGTYVTGGKIVNKDVTLTSKNGYYFSNSRDAYFRYNVVVVTPETTIKSDTLRYNTLTNWTYFYGPTNIMGKDDNLYTENGAYNTKTQYAYFGKKNLYTTGSKSLKGDSLYYDGIAGYGKAVRNIVFRDTVDKTVMYGQLGYYYKIDQRTVVTKNPYVGLGTSDSIMVGKKLVPDTLWMGADTLETQMVLLKTLKLISSPVLKKDNEMGEAEEAPEEKVGTKKPAVVAETDPRKDKKKDKQPVAAIPLGAADSSKTKLPSTAGSLSKGNPPLKKDSILLKNDADHLKKDSIALKSNPIPIKKKEAPLSKKGAKKIVADSTILVVLKAAEVIQPESLTDSAKTALEKGNTDPLKKAAAEAKKTAGALAGNKAGAVNKAISGAKTNTGNKAIAGAKTVAGAKNGAVKAANAVMAKDSIPFNPSDTVKTRIIKAYHNVRVYKSNMQARADSLFYTSSDSTLRWYGKPILWSEGSQQTGDTIYLKLKDKQLNTSQVLSSAFMVNVNLDSARFNQIKGKLITGFFVNGKLNRMFVDGNAESIYFNREKDSIYTEMNQTVSSRIKIIFKEKEISEIITIKDTEGVRTPIKELKADVFLTGFIWKPELRPLSKKEVINGKPKPKPGAKKPAGPKGPKPPAEKKDGKEATVAPPDGKPISEKEILPGKSLPKSINGVPVPSTEAIKKETIKAGATKAGSLNPDSLKTKALKAIPLKVDSAQIDSLKKVIEKKAAPIKAAILNPTTKPVTAPSKKQ